MAFAPKLSICPIYFLLLLLICQEVNGQHGSCIKSTAEFNETYSGNVNRFDSGSICKIYKYNFEPDQKWSLVLCVKSQLATVQIPLLVIIRESVRVRTLQVPKIFSKKDTSQEACHTICPHRDIGKSREETITIELSAFSDVNVDFEMSLQVVEDFTIDEKMPLTVNLTSSRARVILYEMDNETDHVRIEAISPDNTCMVLALQEIKCPNLDNSGHLDYATFYQTMTKKGAISVSKRSFPHGKVFIILVLRRSDSECSGINTIGNNRTSKIKKISLIKRTETYPRSKEVTVRIQSEITDQQWNEAVYGVLGLFAGIYLLSFIICCCCSTETEDPSFAVVEPEPDIPKKKTKAERIRERELSKSEGTDSAELQHLGGGSYTVTMPDNIVDVDKIRSRVMLYIANLTLKGYKYMNAKSNYHFWNVIAVGIFYLLPVVQLVLINQQIVNLTGNQDLCYYNFRCANQFGVISDFNHFYSNIGYVLLGILFMLLVRRRQSKQFAYEKFVLEHPRAQNVQYPGIPYHFEIMYAMGWALIMEGLLSASYHICPNKANFQFDTSFMYVIATICIIKIYFSRNVDIAARASTMWMFLSVVIVASLLGQFLKGIWFWLVFALVHVSLTIYTLKRVYYMGRVKCGCCGSPKYKARFYLVATIGLFNVVSDIVGLAVQPSNFGFFLLVVFISNLFVYVGYYMIMKCIRKESIGCVTWLYVLLSIGLWVPAAIYFTNARSRWEETPAISRENNVHCWILNFYDDHDLWHMLSSMALFTSYMVLFTIDDDVENDKHEAIEVF